MEEKSRAKKAREIMRSESPGKKAAYTKKRKETARKVAAIVKTKQWEPRKVKYLKTLKEKAIADTCIVCGNSEQHVLQVHHADREKKIEVILCANCHDIVRRGNYDELRKAHKRDDES